MEISEQLKEIKIQINKEKYHNANKLLRLARDFKEINWSSISANENISEATLR